MCVCMHERERLPGVKTKNLILPKLTLIPKIYPSYCLILTALWRNNIEKVISGVLVTPGQHELN